MSTTISPLAYVHPSAQIADEVTIGPFAYIDEETTLGEGTTVMPYASVLRGTTLGSHNVIHHHAVLGVVSENLRPQSDDAGLVIGDHNVFRESVVVARSFDEGNNTIIGNHNVFMSASHICHDVQVDDYTLVGLNSVVAGRCHLQSHVLLSTACSIYEGVDVGEYVLVQGGTRIKRNIPPFITTTTNPATFYSINQRILRHAGFTEREIRHIAHAYEIIYHAPMDLCEYISRIKAEVPNDRCVKKIIDFLDETDRKGKRIIDGANADRNQPT